MCMNNESETNEKYERSEPVENAPLEAVLTQDEKNCMYGRVVAAAVGAAALQMLLVIKSTVETMRDACRSKYTQGVPALPREYAVFSGKRWQADRPFHTVERGSVFSRSPGV